MPVMAPSSPGDVVDRLTILDVKLAKLLSDDKKEMVKLERDRLVMAWSESCFGRLTDAIDRELKDLREVNMRLWDLEDMARDPKSRGNDALMASILRCISSENDLRAKLKHRINVVLDADFMEVKEHAATR